LGFERGEAAGFRRSGSRRVGGIEGIDVERQVGGAFADDAPRLLCRPAPAAPSEPRTPIWITRRGSSSPSSTARRKGAP
jgi:hypothetical protein